MSLLRRKLFNTAVKGIGYIESGGKYGSLPGQSVVDRVSDFIDTGTTAEQRYQMAYNADEAQKQRDFEERMSSTAVQRQYQDYLNAGLNPYLVYNTGGASTPTGSSASYQSLNNFQNTLLNSATSITTQRMRNDNNLITTLLSGLLRTVFKK